MGGMKLSELDFVRLLPAFMRDDEAVIAIGKAMNTLMGEPSKRLSTIRTWDKIDELNEAECDELAWELDIDWYDSTGMSLEEKRATIKAAQQIKRKRGTKWAVERLITAYFGEGYVLEWYETGGTPYTFMVLTTNTHILTENYVKFVEAANAAKNERSHIAGIYYYWQQGPDPGVECALGSSFHRYDFKKCGAYPRTVTVGFIVKPSIETEPEETLHLYEIMKSGTSNCSKGSPKNCLFLKDTANGQNYMLHVAAGKLKMEHTTGNVTAKRKFFDDITTGKRYALYVSAGKLRMENSTETSAATCGELDDLTTGKKYVLYVTAAKLTLKSETA